MAGRWDATGWGTEAEEGPATSDPLGNREEPEGQREAEKGTRESDRDPPGPKYLYAGYTAAGVTTGGPNGPTDRELIRREKQSSSKALRCV